jgi:hypothetical protein
MNLSGEELKAKLIGQISKQLDEVLASPTVTMTDIENVVVEFQRASGHEVA